MEVSSSQDSALSVYLVVVIEMKVKPWIHEVIMGFPIHSLYSIQSGLFL